MNKQFNVTTINRNNGKIENIIICETLNMKEEKNNNWNSKFWNSHNSSDVIKEAVEAETIDVSSIQMHDTLSPLLWNENEVLKDDVRKQLLLNVKRFIEFSELVDFKFIDIILTGSLANYNYSENSDIDIHIIMNFNQISDNKEFVAEFLKMKKTLWNENLPIQIKGHDVEQYFQSTDEILHSSGTYSIMNNDWLIKPIKKIININMDNVKSKASDFINMIDDLEQNLNKKNWLASHESLKNKIKKYRQSGLDKEGEFSTENIVFKILRNTGYLKKLTDIKQQYLIKELSL
jgi:predicted nucleotidyltransferase